MVFVFLNTASPAAAVDLKTIDYAQLGIASGGLAGTLLWVDHPQKPKWQSAILLDEAAREQFRYGTKENRERADTLSDYLLGSSIALPVLQTLFKGDRWSRGLVVTNALLSSTFINEYAKRTVARKRPYVENCAKEPDYVYFCNSSPYKSFYSGHAAAAFTAAGLVCAKRFDAFCAAGLTAATLVGYFRIASDAHYLSDVTAGILSGLLFGLVLPRAAHHEFQDHR